MFIQYIIMLLSTVHAEWRNETVIKLHCGPQACHSKANSGSGSGGPRPGYEPSSPLSNYVTLDNFLPFLKTQFSL